MPWRLESWWILRAKLPPVLTYLDIKSILQYTHLRPWRWLSVDFTASITNDLQGLTGAAMMLTNVHQTPTLAGSTWMDIPTCPHHLDPFRACRYHGHGLSTPRWCPSQRNCRSCPGCRSHVADILNPNKLIKHDQTWQHVELTRTAQVAFVSRMFFVAIKRPQATSSRA